MKELTSHEFIDINAAPERIWKILTTLSDMKQWSTLSITFAGEQKLHKGSKILWVDENNEAYATGTVTDFEPNKKLRVSPQFTSWDRPIPSTDIASTFILHPHAGGTRLEFSYGDFSKVPDGESLWESYLASITPTNKELDTIKAMAESKTI